MGDQRSMLGRFPRTRVATWEIVFCQISSSHDSENGERGTTWLTELFPPPKTLPNKSRRTPFPFSHLVYLAEFWGRPQGWGSALSGEAKQQPVSPLLKYSAQGHNSPQRKSVRTYTQTAVPASAPLLGSLQQLIPYLKTFSPCLYFVVAFRRLHEPPFMKHDSHSEQFAPEVKPSFSCLTSNVKEKVDSCTIPFSDVSILEALNIMFRITELGWGSSSTTGKRRHLFQQKLGENSEVCRLLLN